MKNFNKKCLACGLLFTVFQAELYADALSGFAQGLQQVVKQGKKDLKGEFYNKLLEEIRKLPQAPSDFPKAKSFTADILLDAAQDFVEVMKKCLDKAQWIENGGTKDYLFVRKVILPADSVIEFRGDLHGDVHSLIRWLDSLRDKGWFDKNNPFKLIKKDRYLAFLGDYTDRGHYGAEIMYIIMQLFLHNPDNVLIVRGNHEDYEIISQYGFVSELKKKLSFDTNKVFKLVDVYEYMPVAMFLGCKNNNGGADFIQCCHGGMEFGYNSHLLLSDKANNQLDVYEWIDKKIDEKREKVACKRHPDLKKLLAEVVCDAQVSGFQWNDFDFMNKTPLSLPDYIDGRGYELHQKYTTRLLEDATSKNSKNKVLAVFRAHQHNSETVQHILDYGNGVYKLWNNGGSEGEIKKGFDWIKQWSGKENETVPFEKYSVWTFNVAPRTGAYETRIARPDSFSYDTVARLSLKPGFENWTLYPRKIPVK